MDDDGRLIISKIVLQHSGNYTCVAENVAGRTERAIELIVISEYLKINQLSFNNDKMNPSDMNPRTVYIYPQSPIQMNY